ncbi:MAG: aldehyde dehydrogenase family protein [Gaiellaceae bacterium]
MTTVETPITPVRVAGQTTTGDGGRIEVLNPYDGTVVGVVPGLTAADVDRACRHAQSVLERGDFPQHERARVLERAAELLRQRTEEIGRTIALESGKPITAARGEASRAVDTLTLSAVEARKLGGELVPMEASESGSGRLGFALRVPIGVIAAISPFNYPLNLVAHKLGPAIAAGCPVVLKPASSTPLSAIALVELLIEAGMPEDWISVVTGSGGEVGNALVDNPIPRLITFTGSAEVGWAIAARAPRKRAKLELGSNSPVIIEPDGDLERAAARIRWGGFTQAGQSCISTQRVLVHRSVYERFLGLLKREVETLVCGDQMEEATEVGPLIDPGEAERVERWIREAVDEGARLVTGGDHENGVLRPTVLADVAPEARVCAAEIFGPVVAVLPYDSLDQALELANGAEYGLHAGIFTSDLAVAMRAARQLDFGGVIVNDVPTVRVDQQPYGGVRESGNTREGPPYTVKEMTELRFVSLPL